MATTAATERQGLVVVVDNSAVEEGLDLVLSHLKEPLWPRRISTKTTEGIQVVVYSKQEALAWYKAANFIDCRISAYPYYYCSYAAGNVGRRYIHTIDFVMIDLDLKEFKSQLALDRT
jgi:hypothetical protein